MKKLIIISLFLFLALSEAMAQQTELKKIRYLVSNDVPGEVLAAVESDYPGMDFQAHLLSPPMDSKKELRELRQQIIIKSIPEYFAVIKGRHYKKTASYNIDGELITSTERIKNIALPKEIFTTIGREYNGWYIYKNIVTRVKAGTYNNISYEVWLKNGRKKQRLTMDATGKIIKQKRSFK